MYDVIGRLSTASAEENRRHCLFSPAHRFARVVFRRQVNAGIGRNQATKTALKTTGRSAEPVCGETVFALLSI